MRWTHVLVVIYICIGNLASSQEMASLTNPQIDFQHSGECFKSVFVESPTSDTYVDYGSDSMSFGNRTFLKLRGVPAHKKIDAMLAFSVTNLDVSYIRKGYLKIYTHSKRSGANITLATLFENVNEDAMNPNVHQGEMIGSEVLKELPFVLFDITGYIKQRASLEDLKFHLSTDSKKEIDITSRESGLSAELILEMCTPSKHMLEPDQQIQDFVECSISILPSTLEGKFTIQITGAPERGMADFMIMSEIGTVIQQRPIAIPEAKVSYHTMDIGHILPGNYHAVLRMGRVFAKDAFVLKPDKGARTMHVDLPVSASDEGVISKEN